MLMSFVNPGVGETRAKAPLPASMFSNDDLPTFERPMKANSGNDSSGHESRTGALQSKMADEIFTMENRRPTLAIIPPRSNTYSSTAMTHGKSDNSVLLFLFDSARSF